ncbi:sigma-70 family RNA polymerase sigma factor [Dysgonomonas sp. HDW5A]|uniref:RNA polymerase sigma factor n=1 Tax=unclassified Dysgonomonas TaxID=2630389 RepID=UPI00140BFF39|nr:MULTISPECIES: sigma-70 family RNA polymerase sigma factor [unclassified Dysgonomonas]QIK53508.1 sigma-70 family RNA polymerase sigma factor [Dysgonomonas sp. HDW5B]QIK58978.1 sigma-70 family RNA polymerase sigma factor [Dysgonomonas sp. HDW5A]
MDVLKDMTDEELVISYSIGNNLAFDELLLRHQKNVYNYIYFIIRNREMAEDVFQETFIKAITTIKQGRYTENGKFRAWIMRIAHNLVIDYFRQERSENTVSNDETEIDLLNNANLCDNTIEDRLIYSQILEDVKKLIHYLPPSQREVLEMRYYQELSFKEISEQTGISINTALGRMRYAILNIRKMAEEHGIILSVG